MATDAAAAAAQLAKEKWRRGMDKIAHERIKSDEIALRQMRSSDASDKARPIGEMARMALEGVRHAVAGNATALKFGAEARRDAAARFRRERGIIRTLRVASSVTRGDA